MMSEVEWIDIFGDNLRDIMKEQRCTQKELAEDSGLSQGTISKYLNKEQMPSLRAVINMAYALNLSIDEFVDFGDRIE